MPKLIELDAPQALQLPRETAATQGGDQAVALGQLGRSVGTLGRAIQSYEAASAKTAATEYRMQLRSLQRDIERTVPWDQREKAFQSRLPSLKENVLKQHRMASRVVFDEQASIYEDDYAFSLNENSYAEMLRIKDADQDGIATAASVVAADQSSLEEIELELADTFAGWDAMRDQGELSPQRVANLQAQTVGGLIDNLTDSNPALARQVLEKYATSMSPGAYASRDNALSSSNDINVSVSAADEVFDQNPDGTVPQLMAVVRDMDLTPEQRKMTEVRVRQMVGDRETAKARQMAAADQQMINETYETDWQSLDPQEKQLRIAAIQNNRNASPNARATALRIATATTPVVTDQALYGRLWQNPQLVGTPGYEFSDLADRIKGEDWQELEKRLTQYREGTLNSSLVDNVLKFNFDQYEIEDAKDIGSITLQVRSYLSSNDLPVTRENVQQAFDAVKAAATRPREWWFGTTTDYSGSPARTIEEASELHPYVLASIAVANPTANNIDMAAEIVAKVRTLETMRSANPDLYKETMRKLKIAVESDGGAYELLTSQGFDVERLGETYYEWKEKRGRPLEVEQLTPTAPVAEEQPAQLVLPTVGDFDPLPADFTNISRG